MMKRYFVLLSAILFLLLLYGCSNEDAKQNPDTLSDITKDTPITEVPTETKEEAAKKEYQKEDGPRFDLPQDQVERYRNFIMAFNILPQEFQSYEELSDETLVFTAASAMQAEFELSIDGLSSKLPLDRLASKIREYFGADVALSDDYASKDYSPYVIDSINDVLLTYSTGGTASFMFNYALIAVDEGYELYLIDLMDPLFFDNIDNQERLFSGETIEYSEIEDIALEMKFNIYHIVEQANGRLMLKGFRYENYKDIMGYIF